MAAPTHGGTHPPRATLPPDATSSCCHVQWGQHEWHPWWHSPMAAPTQSGTHSWWHPPWCHPPTHGTQCPFTTRCHQLPLPSATEQCEWHPWWHPLMVTPNHSATHSWWHLPMCHPVPLCHQMPPGPSAICHRGSACSTHGGTNSWWHPLMVAPTHSDTHPQWHPITVTPTMVSPTHPWHPVPLYHQMPPAPGAICHGDSASGTHGGTHPWWHPPTPGPPYRRTPPGPRHRRAVRSSGVPACPRRGRPPCPRGRRSRPSPGCRGWPGGQASPPRWVPGHVTAPGGAHGWVLAGPAGA